MLHVGDEFSVVRPIAVIWREIAAGVTLVTVILRPCAAVSALVDALEEPIKVCLSEKVDVPFNDDWRKVREAIRPGF